MKNTIRSKAARRICSLMLALCMLTALCPTAFAATNYNIWVNGTRVTSANAGSLAGGKASYDASSHTLTLNGAALNKGTAVYDSGATAAVYSTEALNVVLKGKNTITGTGFGVSSDKDLKFTGTGSLNITTSGNLFSSIYSGGTATFSGVTVNATSDGSECLALLANSIVCEKDAALTLNAKGAAGQTVFSFGDIKVSGASLSASAGGDSAVSIFAAGKITAADGSIISSSVTGKESFGIFGRGELTVSGGGRVSVNASGKIATGICSEKVSVESGSLTAFGSEAAAFIEGGAVSFGSGFTVNEGDSAPGSAVTKLTDTDKDSGTFSSKKYISITNAAKIVRFGGENRYDTAVLISKNWDKTENVVLANGASFADALAGVPLAYSLNAPILLINGKTVDDSVMKQLSALGAKNVYLLGGEAAISAAAAKQLTDAKYSVERIAGDTRFGTAVAIANKLAKVTGKAADSVYFANGYNYPDALAVSSVAAVQGRPVLYAPQTGSLDAVTEGYIKESGVKSAVVLGGENAVGADVFGKIKAVCADSSRISGETRYETAAAIINKYASSFTGKGIAVATGTNYPDALAGAAFAAKQGIAVMLVPATLTPGAQTDSLKKLITDKNAPIYVFGGTGAVSDTVVYKLAS